MESKICNKCGFEKNIERFRKSNRHADGYNGVCKDCINRDSNHRYYGIKNGTYKKTEITKVDDKYFEKIDTEYKAYWLGFLYADGYVRIRHNGGTIKLKLHQKDRTHIESFKNDIKSEHRIRDGKELFVKNGREYTSYFSEISIHNVKMATDLTKYGCMENKTQKIRLPILNEKLMNHFIRGYFDGDGCIFKIKQRPNSFRITIVSNMLFICDIKNFLKMGIIRSYRNYSILEISKINEIKNFRDFIYKNASIFLKRKKEIFDTIKNEFKRDYSLTRNKKTYRVSDTNGNIFIVPHLRKFCEENNLIFSTMSNLSRGIGKTCRGWKCNKFENI